MTEKKDPAKEMEKVRRAADIVLRTDAGREVWKYLFKISGYRDRSFTMNTKGEVSHSNLLFNEARRGFYLQLRSIPSFEILAGVEQQAEKELKEGK